MMDRILQSPEKEKGEENLRVNIRPRSRSWNYETILDEKGSKEKKRRKGAFHLMASASERGRLMQSDINNDVIKAAHQSEIMAACPEWARSNLGQARKDSRLIAVASSPMVLCAISQPMISNGRLVLSQWSLLQLRSKDQLLVRTNIQYPTIRANHLDYRLTQTSGTVVGGYPCWDRWKGF